MERAEYSLRELVPDARCAPTERDLFFSLALDYYAPEQRERPRRD